MQSKMRDKEEIREEEEEPELRAAEKAAIIMVSMGEECAGELMRYLSDVEIEDPGAAEIRATTDEGSVDYALAATDFRIECRAARGGAVVADASLQSLIDGGVVQRAEADDGATVFTSGTGAKAVVLEASAGDVTVSLLSRSPKIWQ